jgi:hypothetical protein
MLAIAFLARRLAIRRRPRHTVPSVHTEGEPARKNTSYGDEPDAPAAGWLLCTSGPLAGHRFEIRPEGLYIGREASLAQIVIDDNRISKRHVWIGPRGGRVTAVDQGSTNGTFLNNPSSHRIAETFLNPGDTLILSEFDVARFRYQK